MHLIMSTARFWHIVRFMEQWQGSQASRWVLSMEDTPTFLSTWVLKSWFNTIYTVKISKYCWKPWLYPLFSFTIFSNSTLHYLISTLKYQCSLLHFTNKFTQFFNVFIHESFCLQRVTEKQNKVVITDRMWARLLSSTNQPSFLSSKDVAEEKIDEQSTRLLDRENSNKEKAGDHKETAISTETGNSIS